MKLPASLYFLRPGWWLVHGVSVAAVFAAGVAASQHFAAHMGHDEHVSHDEHATHDKHATHDEHAAQRHHDHTSPESLRPLMRQMLVDVVQLQGALSQGDLPQAAARADAIAGSCDDGAPGAHGALPTSLGPSFAEHDRALHERARRLSEALRAGERADALSLHKEMVNSCQSCHEQAPAARGVDLRALTSFADTLAAPNGALPGGKP